MGVYDVSIIVVKEVQNYGKIVFVKNNIENGWWGEMHPPASAPGYNF